MNEQTIRATFPSREQAETAVLKLRALRGQDFRLECLTSAVAADSLSSANAEFAATLGTDASKGSSSAVEGLHHPDQSHAYMLQALIPEQVVLQAQRVIEEAIGQRG